MPSCDAGFFDYLAALDCSQLSIYAVAEGTVVFPRVPLIRIEGPLAVGQLLETTMLNLCNFASLICTNAARHRLAAGPGKRLLEFGLRRAQGPDGAMSASRYAYIGGFDGTSNVLAGMLFGVQPSGTHAHSLVSAFTALSDLPSPMLGPVDLVARALHYRAQLGFDVCSDGELAAFVAFAQAFPDNFLALVDTYDTLASGVPNFVAVALALREAGHTPRGIRLDSGDLAYLSRESRRLFQYADSLCGSDLATTCCIVASNDINEDVLYSLNEQGHDIDVFGIGTNLVTCQKQPALGMVYKLVEVRGTPRIKLSQEMSKVTIPGRKEAYRLLGNDGVPLLDYIIRAGEPRPLPGQRILCHHPFDDKRRAFVTPTAVVPLLRLVWKGAGAVITERLAAGDVIAVKKDVVAAAAAAAGGASPSAAEDGLGNVARGVPPVPTRERGVSFASHHAAPVSLAPAPAPPLTRAIKGHIPPGARDSLVAPLAADAAAGEVVCLSSSSLAAASAGADAQTAPPPIADELPSAGSIDPAELPKGVNLRAAFPSAADLRSFVASQLDLIRADHLRKLNPAPYKVSVSSGLFSFMHQMWLEALPVPELK
jgi:nicotinate phosphoribosyltransferase